MVDTCFYPIKQLKVPRTTSKIFFNFLVKTYLVFPTYKPNLIDSLMIELCFWYVLKINNV